MRESKRDLSILRHIVDYCERLAGHHTAHNPAMEYGAFSDNRTYSDAVAFCVFQISELCIHLSDECRALAPEIPWQNIRGM
jgi:uncharacterized protein with HEPN domain